MLSTRTAHLVVAAALCTVGGRASAGFVPAEVGYLAPYTGHGNEVTLQVGDWIGLGASLTATWDLSLSAADPSEDYGFTSFGVSQEITDLPDWDSSAVAGEAVIAYTKTVSADGDSGQHGASSSYWADCTAAYGRQAEATDVGGPYAFHAHWSLSIDLGNGTRDLEVHTRGTITVDEAQTPPAGQPVPMFAEAAGLVAADELSH